METTVRETECTYQMGERTKITSSREIEAFLQSRWSDIDDFESFHVICLSQANEIVAHKVVSFGGMTGCVCDPKIIFRYALNQKGCTAIAVAHNHPSGNIKASQADINMTKKLKEGGQFLEMPVIDHIILTPTAGKYFSFADEGIL